MPDSAPASSNGHLTIHDLPQGDRPRERLRDAGAPALSVAELVAILLRTGSSTESAITQAQRLLRDLGGLEGLAHASFGQLCAVKGLGEAKAAQIMAGIELGIRASSASPDERRALRSPEDIADLMLPEMSMLEREHVRVIALDSRNRVLGIDKTYQGSVHTAVVRIAELLRDAVRLNAAGIVLVHNHPSGDPTPSAADIAMTKQVVAAGKLMDIDVFDHVVIGGGQFVSMKHYGLGFPKEGVQPIDATQAASR